MEKVTRLKNSTYKSLEKRYIDIWCAVADEGFREEQALAKTKILFQDFVIHLMLTAPEQSGIIATAYDHLKSDKSLLRKAQHVHVLNRCSDEVKNKYLPLL